MRAIDLSYMKDPRLQRKIKKIQAKGPNYSGLVRSLLTDEAAANMEKMIGLASLGEKKRAGQAAIALGEKTLETRGAISKANIASREKLSDLSRKTREAISLADIASREDIAKGQQALSTQAFEYQQKQWPWETAIAAAGIPIQYALGERERKERQDILRLATSRYGRGGALSYLDYPQ